MSESKRTYFLYDDGGEFCRGCASICDLYFERVGTVSDAHFAIAPRLTSKLTATLLAAPALGTLVFHPSALPYRRGPSAIQHAITAGERVSGVTWFWANEQYDAGDICAQEPVILVPGESAGRAYHTRFVPAGYRALSTALIAILFGIPRRFPQNEALATYDPKIVTKR